ncbi:OFA family MFS transporter [Streptomyces tsukubensis]|uniref:MFS transporter n=1 Tax=Streptomyces tsukubensis TaxID=83656 RepID=A0A1V4ADF3_9ACTN|nr:OFA family MFS transporter [Streptomyces tsukubensis]OON81790.1 MFS transporter [Streptomyces tsukubensis]QFR96580.1 MFS transporter [Streptomyces tsukubensis]
MTAEDTATGTAPEEFGAVYREITDQRGRVYRTGETDRAILGRSRRSMVWLPWAAMFAISVFEYAYGSAEDVLSDAHGWSQSNTFWILSVWTFFQAGVSFPTGWAREKGYLPARQAVMVGSVLCLLGFVAIAHLDNVFLAILGFGLLGGVGSGLVYSTCINMTGKWYPEKRGGKTGFVNGGFAYGAVPFIFIFNFAFDTGNYRTVLDLIGVYVLIVLLVCGWFFKDPPKNWWPAGVDPLTHGRANAKTARALEKNPPAAKQYTPMEAIRTGQLPLIWLLLVITAGVSIFGVSFQVPFAKEVGFGPLVAAQSAGILSIVNGVGRGVVGWLSDLWGRKNALIFVILVLGLSQFGVMWAGDINSEWLFLVFAFFSGFGGGAFYPMFASIVPDYFGENNNATNYGIAYSGKVVSGLFGTGLGSMVIDKWGYDGAYTTAGVVALVSAGLALFLRHPGLPKVRGG